jgi:hypothetical protein
MLVAATRSLLSRKLGPAAQYRGLFLLSRGSALSLAVLCVAVPGAMVQHPT